MTECIRRRLAFWTTCTCEPCVKERRRLQKLSRNGRLPRIPSEAAWARVEAAIEAGWSPSAIGSATGLSSQYFDHMLAELRKHGKRRRIGRVAAAKILGPWATPTVGHIPALGATRRLQGLSRAGYTLARLAELTGLGATTIAAIRRGEVTATRAAHVKAVEHVFATHSMRPGPSNQARLHAEEMGWPPPLAWDEDTIDDPLAQPQGVAGGKVAAARSLRAHIEVTALVPDSIAVEHAIERHHITDLSELIDRVEAVRVLLDRKVIADRGNLRSYFPDLGPRAANTLWRLANLGREETAA